MSDILMNNNIMFFQFDLNKDAYKRIPYEIEPSSLLVGQKFLMISLNSKNLKVMDVKSSFIYKNSLINSDSALPKEITTNFSFTKHKSGLIISKPKVPNKDYSVKVMIARNKSKKESKYDMMEFSISGLNGIDVFGYPINIAATIKNISALENLSTFFSAYGDTSQNIFFLPVIFSKEDIVFSTTNAVVVTKCFIPNKSFYFNFIEKELYQFEREEIDVQADMFKSSYNKLGKTI